MINSAATYDDTGRESHGLSLMMRILDLLIALSFSIIAAPFAALAAIAIWLEDGGPVLYRQTRVGLEGAPFRMLKFRCMRLDAEPDGISRWAIEHDPRITCVGKFLRRTRIDELPQLWNVIRGDMRVIGPRPERPFFVDTLSHQIPAYPLRHKVKPGITGWAQVRYRYAASVEECARKLEYDLYYVKHQSLLFDLRILVETVGVVLTAQGTR